MKPSTRSHLFAIPFHALLLAGLLPSATVIAEQKATTGSRPSPPPAAETKPTPEKALPAAFLGVETAPVNAPTGKRLKLAIGTGLRVRALAPDSPASGLLLPGDVLVLLDQQILCNPEQLRVLIRTRNPGDTVPLTLRREGKPLQVEVKLGTLPEALRDARPLHEQLPPLREYFSDLERQLRERGAISIPSANELADMAANLPDDIREHLREVEKETRQHRERLQEKSEKSYGEIKKNVQPHIEDIQKKLRKHREQWEQKRTAAKPKATEEKNAPPAENTPSPVSSASTVIVSDADGIACLTMRDGCCCLKVQDTTGKVIFDGPVDTPEQRKALSPNVAKKLETVEALTAPTQSPVPSSATPPAPAAPTPKPATRQPAHERA